LFFFSLFLGAITFVSHGVWFDFSMSWFEFFLFVVETLGFGYLPFVVENPKCVNLGFPRPNPKSALKWQLFLVLHGMIQASILGHRQNRICELLQSCNNP
jgi:hypothetical protein